MASFAGLLILFNTWSSLYYMQYECSVSSGKHCYYLITLVSVMFAGHLGELKFAGATLANSWAVVTGFTFMVGLTGALDTVCREGFAAKSYKMLVCKPLPPYLSSPLSSYLQSDSTPSPPLSYSIKILKFRYLLLLFAYGFLNNILRFLQASFVIPLVFLLKSRY